MSLLIDDYAESVFRMTRSKRPSKARRLKEHLLSLMTLHRVPVGGRMPSEPELMQQFSISRSTVRQVLSELSAEGLIERQQGRGTFRTGAPHVSHPHQRSMLAGVVLNSAAGSLFGPIAEGIGNELRRWGYHAIFETARDEGAESKCIHNLLEKGLDGFIVSPTVSANGNHSALSELIRRGVPLVLLDQPLAGASADLVCTHSRLGAEQIVDHLVELGHRRIAFVGTSMLPSTQEQLAGFQQAMQAHGAVTEESWIRTDRTADTEPGRRSIARELLSLERRHAPTAIVCATDTIAESIAAQAREMGFEIPGDVSIAGFDDSLPDAGKPPWLTTFARPNRQIGVNGALLLVKRLQNQIRGHVTVLLEGKLVVRSSTGVVAERK